MQGYAKCALNGIGSIGVIQTEYAGWYRVQMYEVTVSTCVVIKSDYVGSAV